MCSTTIYKTKVRLVAPLSLRPLRWPHTRPQFNTVPRLHARQHPRHRLSLRLRQTQQLASHLETHSQGTRVQTQHSHFLSPDRQTPRPTAEILTSIQPRKENTSTTFTLAHPRPAVMPTSTAETRPHTAGTPDVGAPVFIPMRAQPPADNTQQIAETLTWVTQLQRLPQANPDVYRGDEKDKNRFFLWETAFDALVDSAPVSAQQKLHLLYQHLDSKAKKVVEQLQYMIGDPGKAYQEARKKLKERYVLIKGSSTVELCIQDHKLVHASVRTKVKHSPPKVIKACLYKDFNGTEFTKGIAGAPWSICSVFDDPDKTCWAWSHIFNNICQRHASHREVKVTQQSLTWITRQIRHQ